jgi:hypothetical protein
MLLCMAMNSKLSDQQKSKLNKNKKKINVAIDTCYLRQLTILFVASNKKLRPPIIDIRMTIIVKVLLRTSFLIIKTNIGGMQTIIEKAIMMICQPVLLCKRLFEKHCEKSGESQDPFLRHCLV